MPSVTPHRIVYLDNNATTACAPEVVKAMLPCFSEQYGNSSSVHLAGRQALRAVEQAREKVASLLGVAPYEIFFNSGATEGSNWLLQAIAQAGPSNRPQILVSAIEHKSVLDAAVRLRRIGFDVQLLPATSDGVVDLAQAASMISSNTALVAVQCANNETGVVQPVLELAELAHASGAFFHCDAVQALGKAHLNLSKLTVDSAVFSAHKVHAPKGVGALFIRGGARSWPYPLPLVGGGQEHGIRPGTVNVPGIVGFGKAADLIQASLAQDIEHMKTLRDSMEARLKELLPHCCIHGERVPRLPNTMNAALPNVPSDMLMASMSYVCISEGSACASGTMTESHVLQAMGIASNLIENSIRVSISKYTTEDEIKIFFEQLMIFISNISSQITT